MDKLFLEEDGVITIVIFGVILLLVMGLTLILFFYLSRKKLLQKELEKKTLELNHQKEMLKATIVAQEAERNRIAQDLHDDISAKLNVVSLSANFLIEEESVTPKETEEIINHILRVTNKTIESSRKIAHNLLPPILEKFGLGAALEELCDEFSKSKKVNVISIIEYEAERLSKDDELHVFRIIQELMNNSMRHGKAKEIALNFKSEIENLSLSYRDDGLGFDTSTIGIQKGLGLRNIESRVSLLKGEITYKSEKLKGVEVEITL
ncbi:sensor histidine kinase [Kordia sp. YSTF-M3]|uniref:histidine kinase n=1 Tax=Kordia aestuariivivens TaxID=2759037 RepID=A0ABR7QFM1_9FLAO|nr:sensor histidine kinase [Kordia aestuariivivens]MBC8757367.1 sensor histidine kinase [Kordia aestuariivivens]